MNNLRLWGVLSLLGGITAVLALLARQTAAAEPTTPAKPTFNEAEREPLIHAFHINIGFLTLTILLLIPVTLWLISYNMSQAMWISVTAGALGGATTALVSCLNRRANGFEDRCGQQTPDPDTRKERFNQGMHYWFLARPLLGATVAAVIYWGIQGGVFELPLTQAAEVGFYSFLSGLLAKTILDFLRGLLKNIFK